MNISDVSWMMKRFTKKSKLAWKELENKIICKPVLSMDEFLNTYRDRKNKHSEEVPESNPLLNFKFDRERLVAVLRQPIDW